MYIEGEKKPKENVKNYMLCDIYVVYKYVSHLIF